jgi:glycosyltransferase involved in cell wall biosynthesis
VPDAAPCVDSRPRASGKFFFVAAEKFLVRGVTYGTFRAGERGAFPLSDVVRADFGAMSAAGVNTIRTYTPPTQWLLDEALQHGLRVVAGLPWEHHVAFLEDKAFARSIEERVRNAVRSYAGHPALLCTAIGNEIPASIVRWHGARRVERFLRRLFEIAKAEDPEGLVTYVNYPSTEYLQLPFLDLVCFNVFLEREEALEAYLARLQNIAGSRPLVLTELGLDSVRHGRDGQAVSLEWQLRTAFRGGCAGALVFSWTDDWHRDGRDVYEWGFGITDRDRRPKPALQKVAAVFDEAPFPAGVSWPRVSVIVCSHNGAGSLADCLEGIASLDYPSFEVIVVDDGSNDATGEVAKKFSVRLIQTENRGLGAARNTGLEKARGEVVAYIDDDATPDRDWLRYLVGTLLSTPHVGVGGPNIPPEGQGAVAAAVARAPGGPTHVLLTDRDAEHIPGCNMAFWRSALIDVDGFDPRFRVAGDDVDICWRLHERGWTLGFSPSAVVWHRRRDSVRDFFRQQCGYGRAEALLERAWPEKYNRTGQLSWRGRVYGGPGLSVARRWRIYYGTWGDSLFQSRHEQTAGTLASLPLMPESFMLIGALVAASAYGLLFDPSFLRVPVADVPITLVLLVLALVGLIGRAGRAGWTAGGSVRVRMLTALLFVLQPLARLWGRISAGLTPWRAPGGCRAMPWPRTKTIWSEDWESPRDRLVRLWTYLRLEGAAVLSGGSFDRWDIQVRAGPLGLARIRLGVEEHGHGKQLLRFRIWPRWSRGGSALAAAFACLAALAVERASLDTAAVLGAVSFAILVQMMRQCAASVGLCLRALEREASETAGKAELMEVLEGGVAKARSRIHVVVD